MYALYAFYSLYTFGFSTKDNIGLDILSSCGPPGLGPPAQGLGGGFRGQRPSCGAWGYPQKGLRDERQEEGRGEDEWRREGIGCKLE